MAAAPGRVVWFVDSVAVSCCMSCQSSKKTWDLKTAQSASSSVAGADIARRLCFKEISHRSSRELQSARRMLLGASSHLVLTWACLAAIRRYCCDEPS